MRSLVAHTAQSWFGRSLAAALVMLAAAQSLLAQEVAATVVRVQEDWELVVAEPSSELGAPQVTVVFSPVGNLDSWHAAFELNHQSQPSYVAGGMQLQVWNGEQAVVSRKNKEREVLAHNNEVIRWTQEMRLQDGVLSFEVKNGTSTTWGTFSGSLSASVSTNLANLNGYNPLVSVKESGAGYASNRVSSLVLRRVRLHTSTGEVVEDNTAKVAYPKP
jgi:hypothetical protein